MSKSSALSLTREGYKHQLQKLDAEFELIVKPYNTAMRLIESEYFLSSQKDDYFWYVHVISLIMSRAVVSSTLTTAYPVAQVLASTPTAGTNQLPAQVLPQDSHHIVLRYVLAIVVVAAAVAAYFFRVNTIANALLMTNSTGTSVSSVIGGGSNEILWAGLFAGAIALGPELVQSLAKRINPIPESKTPMTVAETVREKLGMGSEGMIRKFRGAWMWSKRFPEKREHFIIKYRAEFPATLGEIMADIRGAYGMKRTELYRFIEGVTKPTSSQSPV